MGAGGGGGSGVGVRVGRGGGGGCADRRPNQTSTAGTSGGGAGSSPHTRASSHQPVSRASVPKASEVTNTRTRLANGGANRGVDCIESSAPRAEAADAARAMVPPQYYVMARGAVCHNAVMSRSPRWSLAEFGSAERSQRRLPRAIVRVAGEVQRLAEVEVPAVHIEALLVHQRFPVDAALGVGVLR